MDLVLVAAPIVLATVFSAAAIGKLTSGVDDADTWRELGLPKFLNQTWLRRAHPWADPGASFTGGARSTGLAGGSGRAGFGQLLPGADCAPGPPRSGQLQLFWG